MDEGGKDPGSGEITSERNAHAGNERDRAVLWGVAPDEAQLALTARGAVRDELAVADGSRLSGLVFVLAVDVAVAGRGAVRDLVVLAARE